MLGVCAFNIAGVLGRFTVPVTPLTMPNRASRLSRARALEPFCARALRVGKSPRCKPVGLIRLEFLL